MSPQSSRLAPILGSLCAVGPVAIDLYLPALPAIATDLGVGEGELQLSLMTFFAGLMLGQLFYGPLSDRTGRRPVIFLGLVLYVIGAIGCALAGSASQLLAWRFVQGLGGSIGMVIGMTIVRDLFTGQAAARLIALIMLVVGLAPTLAPMLGTAIISVLPWRALFWLLTGYGVVCLALVAWRLPETRPPELKAAVHPGVVLRRYGELLVSRRFIAYVAVGASAQAGFFAYIAGSSFVFIEMYGFTPTQFSLLFGLNALGLITGAQISPRLMGRFAPRDIMRTALASYAVLGVGLLLLTLAGVTSLPVLAGMLFLAIVSIAFVMPLTGVMAMEAYRAIAGTAAALMGALQFSAGMVASLIIGLLANGTALPMVAVVAGSGVIASFLAWCALPPPLSMPGGAMPPGAGPGPAAPGR